MNNLIYELGTKPGLLAIMRLLKGSNSRCPDLASERHR